ncbi:hypothetical protein [Haladaptatus sp. DYF46]|nr:hypothetical protein [Haladaptatus sp. DYF46]
MNGRVEVRADERLEIAVQTGEQWIRGKRRAPENKSSMDIHHEVDDA